MRSIQPDGKIVLAGYANQGETGQDFALARYEGTSGAPTIDEGAEFSLTDIGRFTDPGFDNPLNTDPATGGEVEETFTYSVDWGDGTTVDSGAATVDVAGGPGVLTQGSFDGSHTYADNGTYTVTVTVNDDDGGSDSETFSVTVNNVAPTLAVVADQNVDEGALLEPDGHRQLHRSGLRQSTEHRRAKPPRPSPS